MYVPEVVSVTEGARLLLVDYPDDHQDVAKVGVDGTALLITDTVPLGYYWRCERITTIVSNTQDGNPVLTPAGATLSVYKSADGTSTRPILYRDGSSSPGLDVADESQPIIVQQGLCLAFKYAGLTPGTFAAISMQYALMRRVGGEG